LHVKSTLLNINPATNVQNPEKVTYFYASLFMTLTGHHHCAFQFWKYSSENCASIQGYLKWLSGF